MMWGRVIQFLAVRRFNVVDALGMTTLVALVGAGRWIWAGVAICVGPILSAAFEVAAESRRKRLGRPDARRDGAR